MTHARQLAQLFNDPQRRLAVAPALVQCGGQTTCPAAGLHQAVDVIGAGGIEVQLAALADHADLHLGALEGHCMGATVGGPGALLRRVGQADHRQVDACLGRQQRLGVLALPQGLAAFQLHPARQAAQQNAQQRQHPQHQQQGHAFLMFHWPATVDRSRRRVTLSAVHGTGPPSCASICTVRGNRPGHGQVVSQPLSSPLGE